MMKKVTGNVKLDEIWYLWKYILLGTFFFSEYTVNHSFSNLLTICLKEIVQGQGTDSLADTQVWDLYASSFCKKDPEETFGKLENRLWKLINWLQSIKHMWYLKYKYWKQYKMR